MINNLGSSLLFISGIEDAYSLLVKLHLPNQSKTMDSSSAHTGLAACKERKKDL
jgi:hypothetical protein